MTPLVSVIVPVVDEERALPGLLDHLAALPGRFETIVVDGGSADRGPALAREHRSRPRLVHAARGRGRQMNAGARAARGDVLVFLHADTRLPRGAHAALAAALRDPGVVGGNFALRFDGDGRFARAVTAYYALRRALGTWYGDSATWVRAGAFHALGGYADHPVMEDYDLVKRLRRRGRTVCLPGPVVTSARRWERLGVVRTLLAWVSIRLLFEAGVPPARLAALYRDAR